MPRSTVRTKISESNSRNEVKVKGKRKLQSHGHKKTVANVNSNHAENMSSNECDLQVTPHKVKNKLKVKEREESYAESENEGLATKNEEFDEPKDAVAFEENGEVIEMEINAAEDFETENEETEGDSETESETEMEIEAGEISDESTQNSSDKTETDAALRSHRKSDIQKKRQRQSMEERLDKMSDTLLAVQQLIAQNGMMQNSKRADQGGHTGKDELNSSNSDTMIYQNVLSKEVPNIPEDNELDPEITFKVNCTKRDSSSSEDRIDTSDELMEVDLDTEINNRFIADCAKEVQKHREVEKRPYQADDVESRKRRCDDSTDEVIRQAEAAKAKMFKTPGRWQTEVVDKEQGQTLLIFLLL